jgi:hypothetical protein
VPASPTGFFALLFVDLPALPVPFVPASPLALAFVEELFPPPLLVPPPFLPPLSISLTASAAIFKAPAAAPCAALERISPAASLTLSKMPGELFFVLFDFVEVDFLVFDSLLSFFAAIMFSVPLFVFL